MWLLFFALSIPLAVMSLLVIFTTKVDSQKSSLFNASLGRRVAIYVLFPVFAAATTLAYIFDHSALRFAIVAAVLQVLAVSFAMKIQSKESHAQGAIPKVRTAALWFIVSFVAWSIASTLIWWSPLDVFLQNAWTLVTLVIASIVVLGALWYPEIGSGRVPRIIGFGLAVSLLGLASGWANGLFVSSALYHWGYYIGPAELVRQGGWLLWDVPSQYGFLSILTIAWMPTSSLWESLFILNSAANFLLAMTVFLLLRSLGRGTLNLLMSVSVALVVCFFRSGLGSSFWGPDSYPSTGGFRFIWCVALLLIFLVLSRVPLQTKPVILAAGNLVWVLGVLWSAESAIYSTFVWLPGYFLVVMAEYSRQPNFRYRCLKSTALLALPAVTLATALAGVFVVYWVGLGHGPDLRAFYEYGLTYQAGFGSYPLDPGGPGWVLLITYVVVLATLAWKARTDPAAVLILLVVTAAMIYATSSYFVGRSHPNNVWNLAPEVCIALVVAIKIAGRNWHVNAVPILVRLVSAPIFIMLLVGTLGGQALVVNYVSKPHVPLNRIDAALPPIDPNLQTFLEAHARVGDQMIYVCDKNADTNAELLMLPSLYTSQGQANGAPAWLPLAPFSEVTLLPPTRRVVYLERFIARHPGGGWLIECVGGESQWVRQEIQMHFVSGPTYTNSDYQMTFWRPISGVA